jgi:hypothetical protein
MKSTLYILIIILSSGGICAQPELKTKAEASDYESTSMYADVMSFIRQLDKTYKELRTEVMAVSEEGFEIPLVIIAEPMPKSPADLTNDSRIVVYLQGNIHAGEVEGKEALLMFARDLLSQKERPLLKNCILLICPIFNVDGNEKISVNNRVNQKGPKNGVGVRYNGAWLDLNRDAMKMESPEMKGLIQNVLNRWDPYVLMDCHTTNGVYRQEPVTFNWPANPNGDTTVTHYMRDKMMPEMNKTLLEKYKVENCFYGEFIDHGNLDSGYVSYAHEPRYLVNYMGIRNRLGILNENYVYADFKTRVEGCYRLILSLADYVTEHHAEIVSLVNAADTRLVNRWTTKQNVDSFTFDYRVVPTPKPITIKTYEVVKDPDTRNYIGYLPTDVKKTVTLPYLADYVANTQFKVPFAYIIGISDKDVIANLNAHGIKTERLISEQSLEVETYKISNLKGSGRLNQGHYTNSVEGGYVKETKLFPAGSYVIRTDQALANVLVYLLEPDSGEGYLYWNFFDKYLAPQWGRGYYDYPVFRILNPIDIKTQN